MPRTVASEVVTTIWHDISLHIIIIIIIVIIIIVRIIIVQLR